jgi:cell division protein FtsQ
LLVATGVISRKYATEKLLPVVLQVLESPFWQQQIVQLNVLSDGTLEMVPRVGDHVVYFGTPNDITKKLERLQKFYKYGLIHAGWDRYERISVEFDNQIICKKRS